MHVAPFAPAFYRSEPLLYTEVQAAELLEGDLRRLGYLER